jgi:hypothetical protein
MSQLFVTQISCSIVFVFYLKICSNLQLNEILIQKTTIIELVHHV